MPCIRMRMPDGNVAIVKVGNGKNHPKPCAWCGFLATLQCDWKMSDGTTCDRHLCEAHGKEVGPEKHLCPEHQAAFDRWLDKRNKVQPSLFGEPIQPTNQGDQ